MSAISVRPAVPNDAPALSELAARTFRETYSAIMGAADLNAYVLRYYDPAIQAREIADSNSQIFIAWKEGGAIGFMHLVQEAEATELKRIYVDARCHGQGAAKLLLDEAINRSRSRRVNRLWLEVWHRNERAIAFYRKHGFLVVGETELPPAGDFDDNIGWIMERFLL